MITPVYNTALSSELFVNLNQDPSQNSSARLSQSQGDVVNVSRPDLMTDEEAQEVMSEVQDTIGGNPLEAVTVHQGLDYSRVMALLEDI